MANLSNLQNESKYVGKVCSNTKTDFIEITEDKLENILMKFLINFKNSISWITPLSISLTILITILTTANFKEFLSITKEVWQAIFYISFIITLIWFIYKVFFAIKNRKTIKIEYLIKTIKNN